MSLSPLYAAPIKDLHVTTTAGLHQPFGWLRRGHAKITTFRVCAGPLGTLPLSPMRSAFAARPRVPGPLAARRNSLIRVSRRANGGPPRAVAAAARSVG